MTAHADIDAILGRLDELLDSAPSLHDLEHHRLLLVAARRRRALALDVPGRMVAAERMAAAGAMAAPVLMAKVRDVAEGPDEVEIEFGLKLSTEMGAIIARTGGEANFRICVRWSRGG